MTQKELKSLYREELKKVWSNNRMVEHCEKSTAYVVEHNGELFGIEKPSIETSFCFGHGYCGVTTDEESDEANNMADYARNSQEYFIAENLKGIDRRIEDLMTIKNDIINSHIGRYSIVIRPHYCSQTEDCKLRSIDFVDTWNNSVDVCRDIELIDELLAGFEIVRESFVKRLNTYLKRYGMSKIKTWSYLVD